MSKTDIAKAIQQTRKLMEQAVKELDFINAARYRDEIKQLEKMLQ